MMGEIGPKIQILQNILSRFGINFDINGNIIFGQQSGTSLTVGSNTIVGVGSMTTATNSSQNVAIGYQALQRSGSGGTQGNVAVGYQAMQGGSTPSANTGGFNVAIGFQAMGQFSSDGNNVAIGNESLGVMNGTGSGGYNSAIGDTSGGALTTGQHNTFLGAQTGTGAFGNTALTTGGGNVAIGYGSGFSAAASTNRISIGGSGGAQCTADNTAQIGNSSMTVLTVGTSNTASVKALNTTKGYIKVTGVTGSRVNAGSFNVTSITDVGIGDITINWTTAFSNSNYVVSGIAERITGAGTATIDRKIIVKFTGEAAGSCEFQCWDSTATTNVVKDPAAWHLSAMGTQ